MSEEKRERPILRLVRPSTAVERGLSDTELEQLRALGIRLGARRRRPVDVSDMGVPHVSGER